MFKSAEKPRANRRSRRSAVLRASVGITVAALSLAACGSSSSSAAKPSSTTATSSTTSSSSSKEYTFAFVPKLIGIPYFTSMRNGMEEAAKRFGAKFIYEGPTTASVSGQAEDVKTLIAKGVDAVGVSANSPTALCSLVNEAKAKHILFYASDSDVSCKNNRLWVEQARAKDIGYAAVDVLGKEIQQIEHTTSQPTGDVAIISAGPSATNLNTWIKYMKARLASKYPKLHLLPIQYAGENPTKTEKIASRMIAADPSIKGFIGVASTNVPGIAEAVLAAGKKGKIAVTGETDPNTIRKYVEDGVVKEVVLWNPTTLGYLAGWAVIQMLKDHDHYPFKAENTVPGINHPIKWYPSRHMLLLGPPLLINKKNINLNF